MIFVIHLQIQKKKNLDLILNPGFLNKFACVYVQEKHDTTFN